ncbi:MAG: YraN family protein [Anaerolineae bacterium]|nr:YraN family protein [Anaerolineae bacterium]MDK1081743.1 YraN family protein [Anaerolineae bacterium]MDK1118438.1 YraN family protein [Anaerolineae bacterium]
MNTRNKQVGNWGEDQAAKYLEEKEHVVLERNVRTPYGEIDIVAQKDDITIFVEVKTRTSARYGPPEIAVTLRKQEHMLAAAEHYATLHEIDHWQIDVIAVEGKVGSEPQISHFEKALE